jgi:hypothetical protein
MLLKPLPQIAAPDIQALVGSPEGRTLEFKSKLIVQKDEERREFLADVSAFGNAQGGDLVFGVEEAAGIATAAPGVSLADPDAEIRRLESMLLSGLEPRLPVEMRWIPAEGEFGYLVIRIRPSFAAPHRVIFRDHAKFYGRSSAGKYPMDVQELRVAFNATAGLEARLAEIQADTVQSVLEQTWPMLLAAGPFVALDYVPLAALFSRYDLSPDPDMALIPTDGTLHEHFPTLTGQLMLATDEHGEAYSASITRREGRTTSVFRPAIMFAHSAIFAGHVEDRVLSTARGAEMVMRHHGVEGPAAVCVSLIGVEGFWLHDGVGVRLREPLRLRSPVMSLPPIVVDRPSPETLTPLFNRLWNGFGRTRPASRRVGAES